MPQKSLPSWSKTCAPSWGYHSQWHPLTNTVLTPLEIKAKKPACSTPWFFKTWNCWQNNFSCYSNQINVLKNNWSSSSSLLSTWKNDRPTEATGLSTICGCTSHIGPVPTPVVHCPHFANLRKLFHIVTKVCWLDECCWRTVEVIPIQIRKTKISERRNMFSTRVFPNLPK